MTSTYEKKTATLWRSYDYVEQDGRSNPYKLLCSAIIFQTAADCDAVHRYGDGTWDLSRYADGASKEMTTERLTDFIESDWLELLLSWQHDIKIEAVRENLYRRLTGETV